MASQKIKLKCKKCGRGGVSVRGYGLDIIEVSAYCRECEEYQEFKEDKTTP